MKSKEVVARALRQVGLEGFERRPPHHLSGGEKKRVAIAGVLAMDPDVLVFDEPTSGLDPSGSEDLMELLDELNHDGKTIIISTHDVELAYPWADRAILMLEGRSSKRESLKKHLVTLNMFAGHTFPFQPFLNYTSSCRNEVSICREKSHIPSSI